jgi:hypothetical protein
MKWSIPNRVASVASVLLGCSILAGAAVAKPKPRATDAPAGSVGRAATQASPTCGCACAAARAEPAAANRPVAAAATQPSTESPRPVAGGTGMRQVMAVFHQLLTDHARIKRDVRDVPGGVVTVTTSDDPAVATLIRTHVAQMKERVERGQPVRRWDPLFVELFRRADQIVMKVEDVPGGVRVTETSDDPQVTLLIRQHARRGVSEFVARGFDRAHEPTPLPDGYEAAKAKPQTLGGGER